MRRWVIALLLLLGAPAQAVHAAGPLNVVASFSILGDMVRQVGGDRVTVVTLVGPNGDAHVYTPSPSDAKRLADAQLIVVNGLGFEGWMDRLARASGTRAPVVIASNGVTPRRADDAHGHAADPHAWQSVANAKIYVTNIRDALIAADPAGQAAYVRAAAAYLDRLDALEKELRAALAALPAERRKVISTHDAFGYFAQAYGIDFIAPQGVSTDSEASARDVARIITQVRRLKVPAVFLENVVDPRLIRRIADETGAKIGGTLYSDALTGEGGDAPDYIAMMRHNLHTLAAALGS